MLQDSIPYFDAHAHAQFLPYDADRGQMLQRARAAGVKMITVGTQHSTSAAGVKLAEEYPDDVWAAVGFHPAHVAEDWHHDKNEQRAPEPEAFDPGKLRELARYPKVVAIGECGLDYFRIPDNGTGTKEKQKDLFRAQIELAREAGKPLMVHCRAAFGDLIEMLVRHPSSGILSPGVIHFFSGTADDARRLLDLGYSFTFGGVITFARDYDEVIKLMPLDRILSETDAPYVAPAPYRGKRNEPAYVIEVVKKLAELKQLSVDEMKARIWQNARHVFNLSS